MTSAKPRVSVCIPAYNHEQFVRQSIESILNQTFQDFEIVITDDASTDGTVEAIQSVRDDRIRLFRHSVNLGPSMAANNNMINARGDFLAFLPSDDVYLPHKLETQVRYLDENPEIGIVFGLPQFIDDYGEILPPEKVLSYRRLFEQPNRTRAEWLNFFFFKINCLCGPTAMMRRTLMEDVGLHDPRLLQLQDCDYWVRSCLLSEIHVLDEPLVKYRMHSTQNNLGSVPGALSRSYWEMSRILWNFARITDRRFFFEIFPEIGEFRDDPEVPLQFLLAKAALGVKSPCWQTFGLELMYEVLEKPAIREMLQKKGFTLQDYFRLTRDSDNFNLQTLSAAEKSVGELHAAVGYKEAIIAQMSQAHAQTVAERDRQIVDLDRTVSDRDATIGGLNGALADLQIRQSAMVILREELIRLAKYRLPRIAQHLSNAVEWLGAARTPNDDKDRGTLGVEVFLLPEERRFIELAYLTLLRRHPDTVGLHFFLGQLHAGMPKVLILGQIIDSPEAAAKAVEVPGLLDAVRRVRSSWLRWMARRVTGWLRRMRAGAIRLDIEASSLRALQTLEGREFVESAYRVLLKRETDTAGLHFFLGQLHAGMPKVRILRQILESPEAVGKRPTPAETGGALAASSVAEQPLGSAPTLKHSNEAAMKIEFTAHNIRFDDGTFTKPDVGHSMEANIWFVSARRILETVFPKNRKNIRIADLGCLEGGYAVEFARMGFQAVGIEVRESNIAACNYVKANTNLPNLQFIKDDAQNISKYGMFDAVFCCGLLYHLDKPRQFINTLSSVTTKLLILQTHFSTDADNSAAVEKFKLSQLSENEGLRGRWYTEFQDDEAFRNRETVKWSAWDNRRSFWIQREYLLQAIRDAGFDYVMEQYDSLGPGIAENMLKGYYNTDSRGTFIGIKTKKAAEESATC